MVALPNVRHPRPEAAILAQAEVDRFRQAEVSGTASQLSLLNDSVGLRQMKRAISRWSVPLSGPGGLWSLRQVSFDRLPPLYIETSQRKVRNSVSLT